MSLVTINNNVNINTNLFKDHEVMYPSTFVKCVKAGATWLATHSNISYQTSVMMRTDNMLYANSGSELIRVGLIDINKPLSGLTFFDLLSVTETRDSGTGNIIFRCKAKYNTPMGIEFMLVPIAYFNPDAISEEKCKEECCSKPNISIPKGDDVPVTNDGGNNNQNTQQNYFPADQVVTKEDLRAALAQLREELKANISAGTTDEFKAEVMKEVSLMQEVISNIENEAFTQLEFKVGVDEFRLHKEESETRLKALEDKLGSTNTPITPDNGSTTQPNNPTVDLAPLEQKITALETNSATKEEVKAVEDKLANYVTTQTFEEYKAGNTQTAPAPKKKVKKVIFNANGGTGDMQPVEVELPEQGTSKFTVPENKFTAPADKQFKTWAEEANGNKERAVNSNIDFGTEGEYALYAIWEDIPAQKA